MPSKKVPLSELFLKSFVYGLLSNLNGKPISLKPVKEEAIRESLSIYPGLGERIIGESGEPRRKAQKRITNYRSFTKMSPSPFRPVASRKDDNFTIIPETSNRIIGKYGGPQTKEMTMSPKNTQGFQSFPVPGWKVPNVRPPKDFPDLGKLNFLLLDKGVASINCPGPNLNVMVSKKGKIQRTPVILNPDEVNSVIKTFSEKTRIPLLGGTFKAALGNLLLTAVISEYVGSKFIIHKRK